VDEGRTEGEEREVKNRSSEAGGGFGVLRLQREAREARRGLVLGSPVQLELYFLHPPLSVPALNLCLQLLGGFPA